MPWEHDSFVLFMVVRIARDRQSPLWQTVSVAVRLHKAIPWPTRGTVLSMRSTGSCQWHQKLGTLAHTACCPCQACSLHYRS